MNRRSLARALRSFALPLCLLVGGAGALALPAAANASEGIYWTNGESIETGAVAPTTPTVLYEKLGATTAGLALDPAAGTLYWSEPTPGDILDGSITAAKATTGATLLSGGSAVDALSVDAAASKLYWGENAAEGEIFNGSLSATGPAAIIKSAAGVAGIAVDTSNSKIYWANYDTDDIYDAPIAGGGTVETLYTGLEEPEAVAIDTKTGEIFWTEYEDEAVVAAPLAGGGIPKAIYASQNAPGAIAVDPTTGDLYWAANDEIVAGSVSGTATATKLYTTSVSSAGLALLTVPVGAGVPVVSGTAAVGQTLSCTAGTWAADLPESQLYRAPEAGASAYTYAWFDGTTAVKGATSATFKVSEGGSYTCEVTAKNAEGSSTPQTSAATVVPAPAPTVSISTPASGETYTQHETVATKFSCKEGAGGPGIASCDDSNGVATTGSGAGSLNTATPGAYTYSVTAVSKDGKTASATISYTVVGYAALEALPEVTIASLAKSEKAGKVAVKLACEPGVACSGKLTLTATVKVKKTTKGKKGKKGTSKTKTEKLTLASGSYSLAAGKGKTVELALKSSAVKTLQQAKKTKLTVNLKVTVKGGLAATVSQKLTLTATKAKKAKSGKKAGKKSSSGKAGKKTTGKS